MRLMLFWTVLILALVGAGVYQWWKKQRRISDLKTMASQIGLAYSAQDFEGILGWPFALFDKGDGWGIEHVLWGDWQGLTLREFDYWYYDEVQTKGGKSKSYHRFSCGYAQIDAYCPRLQVARETVMSRVADHVGSDNIELESEEFNRAFSVRAPDRKFAFDFVDARMMRWLLGSDDDFTFEASATALLVYGPLREPNTLIPLLGTLKAFHDHVPRVVYELYGQGGETKPGEVHPA